MKRPFHWLQRKSVSNSGVRGRVAVDLRKGRQRVDWKTVALALAAAQITGWVLLFVLPGWAGIGALAVVGVGAVIYDVRRQRRQNRFEGEVPPVEPD